MSSQQVNSVPPATYCGKLSSKVQTKFHIVENFFPHARPAETGELGLEIAAFYAHPWRLQTVLTGWPDQT